MRQARRQAKKTGQPVPVFFSSSEEFMATYTRQLLADIHIKCEVRMGNGSRCWFRRRWGQNIIVLGRRWIQYFETPDNKINEYKQTAYLLHGYKRTGRDALMIGAIHEIAHAAEYEAFNGCSGHGHRFQMIYQDLLERWGPKETA